jgi:transposase InsO family protein
VYLAVIIDLFSRQVVGWSMQPHMKAELVTDALRMAWFRRRPEAGVIVHSDRGSQYCSGLFQDTLKAYGMRSSMSRRGDCWDTQSKIASERRSDLTRAGIGQAAFALTCRSGSGVPRALPGPASVT